LNIPGVTSAGVDYYHEPFRWDQRLYTIFLEPNAEVVDPQLSILSNVMGGTSYRVRTLRHMLQAMDCMLGISKIPPTQYSPQAVLHIYGVVVNFEDLIVDPRRSSTANHHQLVYVNPSWLNPQARHPGFFPIPEPFWPEPDAQRIPTRSAQPTLHYHTKDEKTVEIPEGFPYDKYVYVKNSYKTEGFGFPFGFLKANTHKNAVTLTVVAYNYPALFTLLVNYNSLPGRMPTAEWQRDFAEYLSHTPSYYYNPLRNALKRIGIYSNVPIDQPSQAVQKTINKNKIQAKAELERMQATETALVQETTVSKKKVLCSNAFDVPRSQLVSVLGDLKRSFFKDLQLSMMAAPQPTLFGPVSSPSANSGLSISGQFRGTGRAAISSKFDPFIDSDDLHSLPIADMGIYQDRMQKMQQETLRDPFRDEETTKSLQRTMFGNPYKQDKKVSIDEEDEASAAESSISSNNSSNGSSWSSLLGRKRKPRRRSVSPSHFPIERIPTLSFGDRSVSGKIQTLALGAAADGTLFPTLRIMVQDSSGKAQSEEDEASAVVRHLVMHDGEDDDEDDEDFRRAMFNSDEMELEDDDEAARLRADTPMPGGIGLDDDDEDMEEIHHAQELIPPPMVSVDLDDVEPYQHKKADSEVAVDEEYNKHSEEVKQDLEHLNDPTQTVFKSLVYDPNVLMELQSIPKMIPDRSVDQTSTIPSVVSLPMLQSEEQSQNETAISGGSAPEPIETSIALNLTPIPILHPPSAVKPIVDADGDIVISEVETLTSVESTTVSDTVLPTHLGQDEQQQQAPSLSTLENSIEAQPDKDGIVQDTEDEAMKPQDLQEITEKPQPGAGLSKPSEQESTPTTSTLVIIEETPSELRSLLVRQLRMHPRQYNEKTIVDMIWRVDAATNWTKEQKRATIQCCLTVAKGLRRLTVVALL
ncbi:Integrator complex subunit 6, partial [Lunasporangiospora selenospora]